MRISNARGVNRFICILNIEQSNQNHKMVLKAATDLGSCSDSDSGTALIIIIMHVVVKARKDEVTSFIAFHYYQMANENEASMPMVQLNSACRFLMDSLFVS